MPGHILCRVEENELVVLQKIRAFMAQGSGRSPKAHEIVPLKRKFKTPADVGEIKAFRRLVALAAIKHSHNGHCWLTNAGMMLLDKPHLVAEN